MRYLGATYSKAQYLKNSLKSFIRIATILLQRFHVFSDNTSDVDLFADISKTTLLQLFQLSGTLLRTKVLEIYYCRYQLRCTCSTLLVWSAKLELFMFRNYFISENILLNNESPSTKFSLYGCISIALLWLEINHQVMLCVIA